MERNLCSNSLIWNLLEKVNVSGNVWLCGNIGNCFLFIVDRNCVNYLDLNVLVMVDSLVKRRNNNNIFFIFVIFVFVILLFDNFNFFVDVVVIKYLIDMDRVGDYGK